MFRGTDFADFMENDRAVVTIMKNLEAGGHCDSGNQEVMGVSTFLTHALGGANGISIYDKAGLIGGVCTCAERRGPNPRGTPVCPQTHSPGASASQSTVQSNSPGQGAGHSKC